MSTEIQQVNELVTQVAAALSSVQSVLALGAGNTHAAWADEIHTSVSRLSTARDELQAVQNGLTADLVEIVVDS